MSNIIQKGTPISCGNYVGIALSEPVTIYSLKHLSYLNIDEGWQHIYIDTFCLHSKLLVQRRSFPKPWWDETLFTAIFGNKKSWMLTRESKII